MPPARVCHGSLHGTETSFQLRLALRICSDSSHSVGIVDMEIDDVRVVIPQYSALGDNFLETFNKRKEELDKLNQKRTFNFNFRSSLLK